MSIVQKILYHEDLQLFEDDLGGWYESVENMIKSNEDLFVDMDIEYLIQSWTVQPPKRINFVSPIELEYEI